MNQLSPALLELVARAMNDDESRQELIKHVETLKTSDSEPAADQTHRIDGATVDLGRAVRCGFGEVIFGEGKSAELVTRIIQTQLDQGQSAFITRIDSGVATLCGVRRKVIACLSLVYHLIHGSSSSIRVKTLNQAYHHNTGST